MAGDEHQFKPGEHALLEVVIHTSEHDSSIVSIKDLDSNLLARVKHSKLHPYPREDEYRLTEKELSTLVSYVADAYEEMLQNTDFDFNYSVSRPLGLEHVSSSVEGKVESVKVVRQWLANRKEEA